MNYKCQFMECPRNMPDFRPQRECGVLRAGEAPVAERPPREGVADGAVVRGEVLHDHVLPGRPPSRPAAAEVQPRPRGLGQLQVPEE